MCILVVDDSMDAREIIQAALETSGLTDLAFAASGKEALTFLGVEPHGTPEAPVDVILLDVVMPRIDGIEACARLRADERYSDIPVIMVTGERDLESLVQAFVAGANDYVNKPFNQVELVARVRGALRLKGELDRRKAREEELLKLHTAKRPAGIAPAKSSGTGAGGLIDTETGYLARVVMDEALAVWAIRGKPAVGILAVQIDDFNSLRQPALAAAKVQDVIATMRARLDALFVPFGDGLFVVAIPDMTREEAEGMAETIRRHVGLIRFPKGASTVSVTVAAGLPFAGLRDDPRRILMDAIEALGRSNGDETIFA